MLVTGGPFTKPTHSHTLVPAGTSQVCPQRPQSEADGLKQKPPRALPGFKSRAPAFHH